MRYEISSLYSSPIPHLSKKLGNSIESGLTAGKGSAVVFFRADDIGVPSQQFFEMISLFIKHDMPLCLAVVPTWLTERRWHRLKEAAAGTRLCWHQHGWRHANHEHSGKKQEFGDSRPAEDLRRDLLRGRERLSQLIGSEFFPLFTPPWNRCGKKTLTLLQEFHFRGISRSSGATPSATDLPDFQVNVDLHTGKEREPELSLHLLLLQLSHSMTYGTSGIMLHHQRMNNHALLFLDQLLQTIRNFKSLQSLRFQDMSTP